MTRIESEIANTPRIVISKELIELLYPKNENLPDGIFIRENDSLCFLNYFNSVSPEEAWAAIKRIIPDNLHVNSSIRNKQVWLIDYYNYIFPQNIVSNRYIWILVCLIFGQRLSVLYFPFSEMPPDTSANHRVLCVRHHSTQQR